MATTRTMKSSALSKENKITKARQRIKPVEDSFKNLKMVVYGLNGRGKTMFGASGPRPLIIDCNEKGTMSVRNFPDVEVFNLETWADIDLIYWYLKAGEHDRETVVIDTASSLQALCMKFVLGDEASRDPTKDPTMPGKREWGKMSELMRTQLLNFRNLDDRMNVIFLAQERRGYVEEDEDSDELEIFPSNSPAVRETLTAGVDIIGRMFVREVVKKEKGEKKEQHGVEYRMGIRPNERYLAKDRSQAGLPSILRVGSSFDNPVKMDYLTRLIDRIKKGVVNG